MAGMIFLTFSFSNEVAIPPAAVSIKTDLPRKGFFIFRFGDLNRQSENKKKAFKRQGRLGLPRCLVDMSVILHLSQLITARQPGHKHLF